VDRYEKLRRAIRNHNALKVSQLVAKGANVDQTDDLGCTLLHVASSDGTPEIVQILLDKGANVVLCTNTGFTPLHMANSAQIARMLLNAGAQITARNGITKRGRCKTLGNTPIHSAVWYNRVDVLKVLVRAGGDVNAKNDDGTAPLHDAAGFSYAETVRTLVDLGVNTNLRDGSGRTALDHAIEEKRDDNIQTLIGAGAKRSAEVACEGGA
jgi:ankyrin repeat protein